MTRLLPPVLGALTLLACSTSDVATTAPIPATAVEVDPSQFLGSVACLDAPGAMRLYVATLVDFSTHEGVLPATDAGTGAQIVLPSSAPTPCFEPVQFERIVIGRQYVADIQGYDRTDIKPLAAGSPVMVSLEDGTYVPPRWTTSCGRMALNADAGPPDASATRDAGPPAPAPVAIVDAGYRYLSCNGPSYRDGATPLLDGPVCAESEETLVLSGCAPLRSTISTPTAIRVDLTDALAGATCATSAVQTFTASLAGKSGTTEGAPCSGSTEFDGVVAGQGYTFDVVATVGDAGGRTLTTTCFATAVAGTIVRAACDPFAALHPG